MHFLKKCALSQNHSFYKGKLMFLGIQPPLFGDIFEQNVTKSA